MLSLFINNSQIELGPDSDLSLELRNPMFNDAGSRSYPFKIPSTLHNRKILGFKHRIECDRNVYEEYSCYVTYNNRTIIRGKIKFTVFNENNYEAVILDREGDFYYRTKNTLLRQINFGEIDFPNVEAAIDYINNGAELEYPERIVAFPVIRNESYFDPPSTDPEQLEYNFVQFDYLIHELTQSGNRSVIVPMIYLRHALKVVVEYFGYHLIDIFFTSHPDFNKLIIYNSLSANSLCDEFSYDLTKLYLSLHVPNIPVSDFFQAIEQFFNVRFFVNSLESTITVKSFGQIYQTQNGIDFSKGVFSKSIEPDEKIDGFTLEIPLDSSDNSLNTLSDDQDLYLKRMLSPVNEISDLPAWPYSSVGDLRYVDHESSFYRFQTNKVWTIDTKALEKIFSKRFIGNFQESVDLKLSSLKNNPPDVRDWPVFCGNVGKEWNDIAFRILFTKLLSGESPHYRVLFGYESTLNFNLWFTGANNIYDKFHKEWVEFQQTTKLVKIERIFELKEIIELDFSKKILIDGNMYLIRRIQVTINKGQMFKANMECLTVK